MDPELAALLRSMAIGAPRDATRTPAPPRQPTIGPAPSAASRMRQPRQESVIPEMVAGFIPGVGEAMDVRAAVKSARRGDVLGTLGNAAMAAVGAVPVVGDLAREAIKGAGNVADAARMIDVDGVMRPALNSRGLPIHPDDEGIRNFWRWATEDGRAPLMDDAGNPLTMFHGTPDPSFTEFDVVPTPQRNRGAYFAESPKVASGYAERRGLFRGYPEGAVYPVYLRGKDVNRIDAGRTTWDNIRVPGRQWQQRVFGNLPKESVSVPRYASPLLENGTDAVVIDNVRDPAWNDLKDFTTVAVTNNPIDIKSAIGNSGAFSRTDPRITAGILAALGLGGAQRRQEEPR